MSTGTTLIPEETSVFSVICHFIICTFLIILVVSNFPAAPLCIFAVWESSRART